MWRWAFQAVLRVHLGVRLDGSDCEVHLQLAKQTHALAIVSHFVGAAIELCMHGPAW